MLEETFVPELSVVTIVKNDPEGLSKTLESVISQKNVPWQTVVVL